MRALVRRHRLRAGDRLVFGNPGEEQVTRPIVAVGEHTVVLTDGTILECPPDRACYIERNVDEDAMLAMAMGSAGKIKAD